jgi:hypothetical protein
MMGAANIAFVAGPRNPGPAGGVAANYKLWFDNFKRKVGCNRPMGCLSEPKGDGGIAAGRL